MQDYLGSLYAEAQDYTQALVWYRKAADQGRASVQFILGLMYAQGRGEPQDYPQAHIWYNLAASRAENDADEVEMLDRLRRSRHIGPHASSNCFCAFDGRPEWRPTR